MDTDKNEIKKFLNILNDMIQLNNRIQNVLEKLIVDKDLNNLQFHQKLKS